MSPELSSILIASQQRKLRPGEFSLLAAHLAEAERSIAAARQDTEDRVSELREAGLRLDHLELSLDPQGTLRCRFPGEHSVRIPSGLTQHDRALAMQLLVQILESRVGRRNPIASPGAPTEHELQTLARAAKAGAKRIPPSHKTQPTREQLDKLVAEIQL